MAPELGHVEARRLGHVELGHVEAHRQVETPSKSGSARRSETRNYHGERCSAQLVQLWEERT